jgi:hypothetical protein
MTRESTTLSIAFAVAGEARWTALPSAYTREGIPPPMPWLLPFTDHSSGSDMVPERG